MGLTAVLLYVQVCGISSASLSFSFLLGQTLYELSAEHGAEKKSHDARSGPGIGE